jgi:hypothetical protein
MNEIAGVISARGRAALSLRDLFYDAAPARAQIFAHAADAWRCSEGPIDDLSASGTNTRAALGMLTYHAEAMTSNEAHLPERRRCRNRKWEDRGEAWRLACVS